MKLIENIVILATTKGSRISPMSNYIPKVLLPIIDRPIIAWHLERAELLGAKKALIIIDEERGVIVKESIKKGYSGNLKLIFIIQKKRNGFLNALLLSREYLEEKNFIVALGDEYDHSGTFFKTILNESAKTDVCLSLVNKKQNPYLTEDEYIKTTDNNILSYRKLELNELGNKWLFGGLFFSTNEIFYFIDYALKKYHQKENNFGHIFQIMINHKKNVKFIEDAGPHINLNTIKDFWGFNKLLNDLTNPS